MCDASIACDAAGVIQLYERHMVYIGYRGKQHLAAVELMGVHMYCSEVHLQYAYSQWDHSSSGAEAEGATKRKCN